MQIFSNIKLINLRFYYAMLMIFAVIEFIFLNYIAFAPNIKLN
jgi:hypothetical protein